ncbi:MAG: hypothetical protein ACRD01_13530 [Terriglobales bacterium]
MNGLEAVLAADRAGSFLVTDSRSRIIAEPALRGGTPASVAAEIRATQQ